MCARIIFCSIHSGLAHFPSFPGLLPGTWIDIFLQLDSWFVPSSNNKYIYIYRFVSFRFVTVDFCCKCSCSSFDDLHHNWNQYLPLCRVVNIDSFSIFQILFFLSLFFFFFLFPLLFYFFSAAIDVTFAMHR